MRPYFLFVARAPFGSLCSHALCLCEMCHCFGALPFHYPLLDTSDMLQGFF
eukprot:m.315855 g.315855  ORF g.315855 m.315855 type:complete len:51 (+) comp767409_c0_seq1:108-260(+)